MNGDAAAARIEAFGDEALLVTLGEAIELETNQRVHALARMVDVLRDSDRKLWGTAVPGYASLLVPYDPARLSPAEAADRMRPLVDAAIHADITPDEALPIVEIPVRYGRDDGPDLAEVAARTGLTEADVIERHASGTYRVYLLGFAPGFAYLGALPPELELPRRASPRPRVPAGSVAIAGRQTAVYPSETPGGWQLIGRTDTVMWDPNRTPPALLTPGRLVRFVPERP